MSRRGIGRAAAPVTGLLGLILIFGPGRPFELPEHYRVELEVPPVDAALWFAARYPEYFTSGEQDGLQRWLDGLEARDRVFVLAMAQTLTWTWVEHELASFDGRELDEIARHSIVVVRRKTLNQLELNADHHPELDGVAFDANFGDPNFGSGVFARLIRGANNCEGQNHLVAVLLDAVFEPSASLAGIDVEMAGVPGHDLVRLSGPRLGQPVFIDAWSNLPPFTVDPTRARVVPTLAELGEAPPPVIPGLAGRAPRTTHAYENSGITSIELLPERRAPTKRVNLRIRAPALDEQSLAKIDDPWRLYLYARVLHIYDDPRAAELYGHLLEHHCPQAPPPRPFLCVATQMLLERI